MRLTLLALAVPAICLAQTPGQPRLLLETSFDFGQVAPDATVTHRFKASNTGSAPLTIGKLTASCGCTSTVVGRQALAPGESTELEVTFNPAGASGPVHKSVAVASDDPDHPVQTLTFDANVMPSVVPGTQDVWFKDLTRQDRPQASVRIDTGTGQPIQLSNVQLSKAPWLGVTTRELGPELWVEFLLRADSLPQGKLSGTDTVTLQMSNPLSSTVQLRVHWELRPPVIAIPGRVAWAEPAGQDLHTSIQLTSRDHKPFRVLSARTSNPLLQVTGISPRAAATQGVQLRLSPEARAGAYNEKLFLTLDTAGHPELEIAVEASLQ